MYQTKRSERVKSLLLLLYVCCATSMLATALLATTHWIVVPIAGSLGFGALVVFFFVDRRIKQIEVEVIDETKRFVARLRYVGQPPQPDEVEMLPENVIEIDVWD